LNFLITTLLFKNLVTHVLSIDLARLYNIGFLLGMFFSLQILSGMGLALVYNNNQFMTYYNCASMDLECLYYLRSYHILGTSLIWACLYSHIVKVALYDFLGFGAGLLTYLVGVVIFVVVIVISFLGYVLPLSQMSYWGLVVFSNILSALPLLGLLVCYWVWGGEFISSETIGKVHAMHVFIPFLISFVVVFHIYALHITMSSESFFDKSSNSQESTFFQDYSLFKDVSLLVFVCTISSYFFYIYWNFVFHEESFEVFDPQKTSSKIIPEWFFLCFFGFIKAFPSKQAGFFYLVFHIVALSVIFLLAAIDNGLHFKVIKLTFTSLYVSSLVFISALASVVVLVYPTWDLLFLLNIFVVSIVYFKWL